MKKIFLGLIVILSVSVSSFGQQGVATAQPAAAGSASKAVITFAADRHEFGSIPQGTPANYTFTFKNTGKEPLVLSSVTPSCGCTTPEWPKEPIAPGASANIKVTYSAASPGEFTKTIAVKSNASVADMVLTIHGDVKAPTTAANSTAPVQKQGPVKKS